MSPRRPDDNPLPALLGVAEVMARYGLRDRRAARAVMDAAGAFLVGRRLFVDVGDLLAYEERQRAARRAGRAPDTPSTRTPPPRPPRARAPLEPGWWREGGG